MPKRELLFLSLVLLLAAVLRMGWPGLTEFKQDEAHLYRLALNLAEFKALPLRGIGSSAGLPNSPLSVYLFALPLLVWKSPLAATLFVGALNTASVALTYALARRYWGARAALIAALLYAAAPWAVIYSRKIWAQNLLPLFTVGYLLAGLLTFVEARPKWLIAHLVLLAVIIQIHFSGLALAPVTIGLLLIFNRRVDWRMAVYGLVGAALTALPFGLYLAGQGGDARTLSAVLARPAQITGDALELAALVAQGTYTHSLVGPAAVRDLEATFPNFNPLLYLGGALALLGAAYSVYRWATNQHRASVLAAPIQASGVVALYLFLPILFFVRHSTPVFPHYFILLFPAPYLFSGIFLDRLLARARFIWQRGGLWLIPLLIAGSQVWLWLALLQFVSTQATPGAFGTPLKKLLNVAEAAKQLGRADIVVVSSGADPDADLVPAVFEALLHDGPHRFVDGRTTAVFPAGEATVVVWPGDYPSMDVYRAWSGGQWAGTVPLRAGEGDVRLAHGPGRLLEVPYPREASALLNNGAELLGSGGNAARWELWWRAPESSDREDYHVFAHLLDANGERVAQADESTYAQRDWRANDLVVNYFVLAGAGVSVRAGMYAYPSLIPASVLDAEGNPAGEWIVFPLSRP